MSGFALTLCLSVGLHGEANGFGQSSAAQWEASCSGTDGRFALNFRSPIGQVDRDDMLVTVAWPSAPPVKIPVAPAWFTTGVSVSSDIRNICRSVVGHELPNHRTLLWLTESGRPSPDQVALVLLDTSARRVLDVLENLGEVPHVGLMIVARPNGSSVLLNRHWLQESRTRGQFAAPDWKDVRLNGDRISAIWRD